MVPPTSHRVPRVPWYSGSCRPSSTFAYGAFTLSGRLSQNRSAGFHGNFCSPLPRHARMAVWALPRSLAATYGIDVSFSSSAYLDVSVQRVPSVRLWIHRTVHVVLTCGFPHSEICGSMAMCASPQLFAACHVLLRLSVPRHPPCALPRWTVIHSVVSGPGSSFNISVIRRVLCRIFTCPAFRQFLWLYLYSLFSRMSHHIRYTRVSPFYRLSDSY